MEIVFCPSVRPCNQEISLSQGHGESVQKSGYLQEERVEFVWEQKQKLGLSQSVSQSVDELRETFIHMLRLRGLLFVIFFSSFFFLILYIVISSWISNESTCIIPVLIMNHATWMSEWMIIFTTSTSTSTTLEFRLFLCVADVISLNGGWMVPCQSVHHMVSMCRSNTDWGDNDADVSVAPANKHN